MTDNRNALFNFWGVFLLFCLLASYHLLPIPGQVATSKDCDDKWAMEEVLAVKRKNKSEL